MCSTVLHSTPVARPALAGVRAKGGNSRVQALILLCSPILSLRLEDGRAKSKSILLVLNPLQVYHPGTESKTPIPWSIHSNRRTRFACRR